ncbi:NF-X1-type zinc finger protein NFXL1 [Armadillidium vulgare]|nr:NF-X1-type zinc finger protein NFXL1 [Armadillidium vulgare]
MSDVNDINDDDNESLILNKILNSYDNKSESGLSKIQYHLQEAIRRDALTCLVCIETITRTDALWNCDTCYTSFHLGCIQKWAKDSIFLQSQAEDEDTGPARYWAQKEKKEIKWFCPKCRSDYQKERIPYDYKCFCGKSVNPQFDPWLIPHSCGERCGKDLKPSCGHSCTLLCHPGPCPPCPVMVSNSCYCRKSKPKMRRCSAKRWSCGSKCANYLACNIHRCGEICHEGSCPPCELKSKQKCECNSSVQLRPCNDLVWHCDKVCGKAFSCSHHKCELVCHSGSCGNCPREGKQTCPCGKKSFELLCTESIPTCGDTCSKPLACGVHFCAERCHKYACPSCIQVRVKKCSCGLREKELPCSKTYICDVKCKRKRDCGRHLCNRKCCSGDCPSCDQICGKTLSCGQHKCESRCHRMKCFPCSLTHKISCTCGGTTITVPCGRQNKTPIPKCNILCKKKSSCHHPTVKPHPCHPGKCPPCTFECGLKLQCKHTCKAPCHDSAEVKVSKPTKRLGPWEQITPKIEIKKLPCPPCLVSMPVTCFGNHETICMPCHSLNLYSCGRECGRDLSCSHHKCEEKCHTVIGAENDKLQGLNCKPCSLPCSQLRPNGCSHPCKLPCHPGPCSNCIESLRMQCHCGILKIIIQCEKWAVATDDEKESLKSCTSPCSKLISCGHRCRKICHSGNCSNAEECRKKVPVRCPCKRLRRDVPCCLKSSSEGKVECDATCKEKEEEMKKEQEQERIRIQEEEEKKLKKEQQEFERLFGGRRKKRRRKTNSESDENQNGWLKWKTFALCTASATLVFAIYYYYL